MTDDPKQPFHIIVFSGDVMAAAEIYPFHLRQISSEFLFKFICRGLKVIRILFAERMKMQTVKKRQQGFIELFPCGSQAGARGAGIINGMPLLGGTLRIDPKTGLFSKRSRPWCIFPKLGRGIEYQMIGIGQKFLKFVFPVSRREHMRLPAKFFFSKPCLVKTAGCGTGQILTDQRINRKHGKGFLCEKDPAGTLLFYFFQQLQIPEQAFFINEKIRCTHQSTSTGWKSSVQGSPHLFRASMKGSGSNSSMLWTPGLFQVPVISIMAPIMAGTPVV